MATHAADAGGPALIEPVPVTDVFISGYMVEDCGDYFRVLYYVTRDTFVGSQRIEENVIVARHVFTREAQKRMATVFLRQNSALHVVA